MKILAVSECQTLVFDSIEECAKYFGKSKNLIQICLENGEPIDDVQGKFYFDVLVE
jgi:hypothetical protein